MVDAMLGAWSISVSVIGVISPYLGTPIFISPTPIANSFSLSAA